LATKRNNRSTYVVVVTAFLPIKICIVPHYHMKK
jgi:hypothetical protein